MTNITDTVSDGEMEKWVNDASNLVFLYVYDIRQCHNRPLLTCLAEEIPVTQCCLT